MIPQLYSIVAASSPHYPAIEFHNDDINSKPVRNWPHRASYIAQRKAARSRRNLNKRGAK